MSTSMEEYVLEGERIAYHHFLDLKAIDAKYPLPRRFMSDMMKWSPERMRQHQEILFKETLEIAWQNDFYQEFWGKAGIRKGDITSLEDLDGLPVLSHKDFRKSLAEHPPFGLHGGQAFRGRFTTPLKIQSSGGTTGAPRPTFFEPIEIEVQAIQVARALLSQGVQAGDVMQIPVTAALANLAWIYYRACHNYLSVIPLTTGSGKVTPSRSQLELAAHWGSNVWGGFPDYQLRLTEVAQEAGFDLTALKTRLINSHLGADPGDAIRRRLAEAWNCPVYDQYGTHEVGVVSFETADRDGLYFNEDTAFIECLDPDTYTPVPLGARGNLVVTSLYRRNPPLIRYDLGDQTILKLSDGRTSGYRRLRMTRFLGRSDDKVKVRGTNVSPESCAESLSGYSDRIGDWICVVSREERERAYTDHLTLRAETKSPSPDLVAELQSRLTRDLGLVVGVELVGVGELSELTRSGSLGERKVRRILDLRTEKITT